MFNTPYNRKIKDEMIAIDKSYIKHDKKVSTKGLLNVSADGNTIGGSLPVGVSANLGRPIGGALTGGRKPSKWIEHVKAFAKEKGINYREALRLPECKASYKKVGGASSGGARTGGKKFKQVGANIVSEANDDLKQYSSPTSATVPPKVGGSSKPKLSAKTQAEYKKEKLKADASALASELDKLRLPVEDPYMDMSGAFGKPPAVDRTSKPKGSGKSGGAKRKPSKWIEHVKNFASKNGISYREALRSPECKASYRK